MTTRLPSPRRTTSHMYHRVLGVTCVAMLMIVTDTAAWAQDANVTRRVDRLEREMRAVQRQVFPGGSPAFFEPEIAPDNQSGARTATPPNAPLANVNARVDSLEAQLRSLTDQTEQSAFKLARLEQEFAAFKAAIEARLTKLEATAAAPVTTPLAAASPMSAPTPAPTPTPTPAATSTRPAAASAAAPPATAVRPTPERLALVRAVEIPATGNAAEDAYNYGFRLWDAKLYPEAQAQLRTVVERHASHRLASFAGNLLGRAYLDEGKPSLAAVAFYNNYKDRPNGERAPHSLLYMGIALDRLNRKADACKAFKELEDVYGDRAPASVRTEAAAARAKAGC